MPVLTTLIEKVTVKCHCKLRFVDQILNKTVQERKLQDYYVPL